jgi:hypothetical protein
LIISKRLTKFGNIVIASSFCTMLLMHFLTDAYIPKANGKPRPLGISALRDRVCMTAGNAGVRTDLRSRSFASDVREQSSASDSRGGRANVSRSSQLKKTVIQYSSRSISRCLHRRTATCSQELRFANGVGVGGDAGEWESKVERLLLQFAL